MSKQRLIPLASQTRSSRSDAGGPRGGAADRVLALQQAVGNRTTTQVVRRLLRQPASLLAGLDADTKKKLQIATTRVPADFADDESFARKAPEQFKAVDVQFGSGVPSDATLRRGLQVIAWDMLDPAGHKADDKSPFRENSTVTLALDLTAYKGKDGLWQFTYVTYGKPPRNHLLIDYVGPAPNYDAPDSAATTFTKLGFKMKGLGGPEKDAIYSAVTLLPERAAKALPSGLSFVRGHDPPAGEPANAGADYNAGTNAVTVYDSWKPSAVRYERAIGQVAVILHEIGHALEHATGGDKDFADALKKDGGTAISGYGATAAPESYAECFFLYVSDPKLLEALRPSVYAFFSGKFG